MSKKRRTLFVMLPLILILAACASLRLPGTSPSTDTGTTAQQGQGQGQPGQPFNMANQPVEQKLALGTLKLEGSNQAVTAEQAKALLPLWKAVKTMSSDSSASPEEINALYQQIEEAMAAEQVQAIKDLNLSQEDLQALMRQYNVQFPQMGPGMMNGTPIARTPGVRRTPGAQSGNRTGNNSGGQTGGAGGFGPGGDMMGGPPPDGAFPGGQNGAQNSGQPNAQGTPRAGNPNRGFRGGMNNMFIDPLIKVLQDRAGIQVTPTP